MKVGKFSDVNCCYGNDPAIGKMSLKDRQMKKTRNGINSNVRLKWGIPYPPCGQLQEATIGKVPVYIFHVNVIRDAKVGRFFSFLLSHLFVGSLPPKEPVIMKPSQGRMSA